jgi:hypothetical protein
MPNGEVEMGLTGKIYVIGLTAKGEVGTAKYGSV